MFDDLTSEHLLAIVNSAHNGIVTIDRFGIITVINRAAGRIVGIPAEEAVGRHVKEVIPNTGLIEVLKTGQSMMGQRMVIAGRQILSNRSPVVDSGQVVGAVGIFQDLSEIEEISRELSTYRRLVQELEAVIESSNDGIFITDGQGVTLRANSAYQKITGIKKEEVVGRHMAELVKQGLISDSATLHVLKKREPVTIMQRVRGDKDLIVTGNPVFDETGNISMVVTNVRDITRLTMLQQELQATRALTSHYQQLLAGHLFGGEGATVPVVCSPEMKSIFDLAAQVAPFPTTVLLQGESGVGKEVVAAFIHERSKRCSGPFLKINCGAIPESLLESELFGYEAGAFTGAKREGKPGLFELANQGTIMLDEIDGLPVDAQVKLLRVIQDKELTRVGGTRPVKVDVRIISATNKGLKSLADQGKFRSDLFYRLNVVSIHLPPLRERRLDIEPLVNFYLSRFCRDYGVTKKVSSEAMDLFTRYDWPGNIRELKNCIENLVVSVPEVDLTPAHLPASMLVTGSEPMGQITVSSVIPLRRAIEQLERQLLERAVAESCSVRGAARALEIDHATLIRKMRRLR